MIPEKNKPLLVETTTTLDALTDPAEIPSDERVVLRWETTPTAIINQTLIYDVSPTDT